MKKKEFKLIEFNETVDYNNFKSSVLKCIDIEMLNNEKS